MISYTWTDNRLNYTGNAALKAAAFTKESKCVQYYPNLPFNLDTNTNQDQKKKCKRWSDEMLPPPIWSPTFEFQGLALGMDTTLTDNMKIENGVSLIDTRIKRDDVT